MTLRMSCVAACLSAGFAAAGVHAADNAVDRIRGAATPIQSPDDLDPLVERIGDDVRLVLLGESTHGTREFYTWRDAISRRLITDRGFNFIAVEGDWAAIAQLDRYVRDLPGAADSAREVLLGLDRWPLWMWANEEIVALAEWLRSHNEELPREKRIGFFGIDVYGSDRAIAKVDRLLGAVAPEAQQQAADAYACFAPHAGNPRDYVQGIALGGPSCEDAVRSVVALIRELQSAKEDEAVSNELFRAKLAALAVKHAERHFRSGLEGQAQSWNARAEYFFLSTEHLLEHFGEGSRGVVWAHNTHVGDAAATQMGQVGMVNIGRLARNGLGAEAVLLIGFATYRGETIAGRSWEAKPQRIPLPPAAPGSLDALLNEVGESQFLFFTSDVADVEELQQVRTHRAIGVTYQLENERRANYPVSLPLERFDVIFFLRETTPLTPLHELPEDSPD